MTLDEAIEELDTARNDALMLGLGKRANALELGIEALKVFKLARVIVGPGNYKLLPGETKE